MFKSNPFFFEWNRRTNIGFKKRKNKTNFIPKKLERRLIK